MGGRSLPHCPHSGFDTTKSRAARQAGDGETDDYSMGGIDELPSGHRAFQAGFVVILRIFLDFSRNRG